MKQIDIVVFDGIDEERLMKDLACIIEGSRYFDQLPARMDGTLTRSFILDSHNDWFASLIRKGNILHTGQPPVENDTLCICHRYRSEALMAIKPWLEYRFSPKV